MEIKIFRYYKYLIVCVLLLNLCPIEAEDGYRLWLRYDLVQDTQKLNDYRQSVTSILFEGRSMIFSSAREELSNGLKGLLGVEIPFVSEPEYNGQIIIGTPSSSSVIREVDLNTKLRNIGDEGFIILTTYLKKKKTIIIAANKDIGVLYGVYHFLQKIQSYQDISAISIEESPKTRVRILNHWDNLNRTVERGYAGFSLWDWHKLPDYVSPSYKDYARANASVGINGTVLTNVNANALVLTNDYLQKVAALADVFRLYGIKVYLTARFSAPIEIGGLKTADPLDSEVIEWWKNKADEIYSLIPDFGGFLVKANSEGQPGPQNYGRNHADGANMLADAVAPHGGIIMWRAFVYDNNVPVDRAKQAYNEFKPLDGKFRKNVLIQVKNGAIDFQPREPFHPLFGAMPHTPLMMEFQITQEYTGFATHLFYQAVLYKECLNSDTYTNGKGSTVANVIDGSLHNYSISGMAGVSNIGDDRNWTGHPFAQANWYAFGRLTWNPYISAEEIADEWIRMTFSNKNEFITPVKLMMLRSREILVNYMTPLGLHHIMGRGHHYGPGPWVDEGRADWTSIYYHRADSLGIGFDRSSTGSDAVSQYFPEVRNQFNSIDSCPEEYLLWFHHVPWDFVTKSGRTLWNELCYRYNEGADSAKWMLSEWEKLQGMIDEERFEHVKSLLKIQVKEAGWWRDACISYFQSFSKRPVPDGLVKPEHDPEFYKNQRFYYVPGI